MLMLQTGDWARVSAPATQYFSIYITTTDQHQDSVKQGLLGLSQLVLNWQVSNLNLYKVLQMLDSQSIALPSIEQMVSQLSVQV